MNKQEITFDELERIILQLKAENDKLREYTNIFVKSAMMYGPCDLCPYKDDGDVCDCDTLPMSDGCKFNNELREFGIEVK